MCIIYVFVPLICHFEQYLSYALYLLYTYTYQLVTRRSQRTSSGELFQQTMLSTIGEVKDEPSKSSNGNSELLGTLTKQASEISYVSNGSGGSGDDKGLLEIKGFSDEFIDFVLKILSLRTGERVSARHLIMHPWLASERDDSFELTELGISIPSPSLSRSNSFGVLHQISSSPLNHDIVQSFEVSGRERHLIEEFNVNTGHTHDIHLPPLEPPTPSVGKARKMLEIGKNAVSAALKGEKGDGGK